MFIRRSGAFNARLRDDCSTTARFMTPRPVNVNLLISLHFIFKFKLQSKVPDLLVN